MSSPRLAALPAACLLLAALALPAGARAAAPAHTLLSTLEGSSTPAAGFGAACGVAVDSAGDVYVADYRHDAVDVFGPGRVYLTQIAAVDPANGPCGLAVDNDPSSPAYGDVYVNDYHGAVRRYAPSSYPPTASTVYGSVAPIDPGSATGVAVDPASGDVYVDRRTWVARYAPSGAPLAEIGVGGSLGDGYGVAVSAYPATAGEVYVADAASGTVKAYDPAGDPATPVSEIDGVATPQGGFAYLVDSALAVDSSSGHLYVIDNVDHLLSEIPEAVLDEFNSEGAYRGQIASILDAEPSGVAVDDSGGQAQGNVYVTSGAGEAAQVDIFGPTKPAQRLTIAKTGSGAGTVRSTPAGIACGRACSAEYNSGEKVTLTAIPAPHSAFAGFSGACSGTGICEVTMSAAREVEASFAAIPQQELKVSVTGAGAGTVSSSPAGIQCSKGTCAEHFDEGSTVTLTAEPATHSRFAGWSGVACDESTATTCRVEMTHAESIAAQFAPIPQADLEVDVSGPGEVTSSPAGIACTSGGGTCTEHFDTEGPESTVTLTAFPAPHQMLSAWSGCESQPSPDRCEVTISAARSVSAEFVPILHNLTVTVVGQGSVSADRGAISACTASGGTCAGSYPEAGALTLSATPAPGFAFAGWSGACGGTGACHLRIEADTAVSANFAPIPLLPAEPIPARLSLGKLSVRGATATLKLSVSGPGALSASGKGLKAARAQAAGAGALTLRLALSGAGRRALGKHRKLTVKVTVAFTPSDGAAALSATKTVTFRAKGR